MGARPAIAEPHQWMLGQVTLLVIWDLFLLSTGIVTDAG